jgi:WAS family protein 1
MYYEMGYPVYSVPIIQQDLRQEETVLQIADALDYLDQVVNDIFDRVQSRIEESKAKLEILRKRQSLAKLKVEKLTGSSKATKVNQYVIQCAVIIISRRNLLFHNHNTYTALSPF